MYSGLPSQVPLGAGEWWWKIQELFRFLQGGEWFVFTSLVGQAFTSLILSAILIKELSKKRPALVNYMTHFFVRNPFFDPGSRVLTFELKKSIPFLRFLHFCWDTLCGWGMGVLSTDIQTVNSFFEGPNYMVRDERTYSLSKPDECPYNSNYFINISWLFISDSVPLFRHMCVFGNQ